jgi:ATP-dependent DNA helicase RecQ
VIGYAETSACRHDAILRYFEDEAEELGGCGHCDNCRTAAAGEPLDEPDEEASGQAVRDVLGAIRALPFAVGPGTVASYLVGHGSTQVRKYDWQTRKHFGLMQHRREEWVRRLLRRLVAAGLLARRTRGLPGVRVRARTGRRLWRNSMARRGRCSSG